MGNVKTRILAYFRDDIPIDGGHIAYPDSFSNAVYEDEYDCVEIHEVNDNGDLVDCLLSVEKAKDFTVFKYGGYVANLEEFSESSSKNEAVEAITKFLAAAGYSI